MSWHEHAACKARPEVNWFPNHRAGADVCRAICATCPVKADCLADALSHWNTAGMWGGTTQDERESMPRARLRAVGSW